MTVRGIKAAIGGFAIGAAAVASGCIPGLISSGAGRVVLWPVFVVIAAFPPPCWDRGPGLEPFCEGTPVQWFAAVFGLFATFGFYAALGTALSWLALRARQR